MTVEGATLCSQQQSDVQLPERLASLGIMGTQLRASLKPLTHHGSMVWRGFRRALIWGSHYDDITSFQTADARFKKG